MEKERNLGVTEARFALTILTCLLVAIGYIALLRLGGTKDPSVDNGPDDMSSPGIVDSPAPPVKPGLPPRVLSLEKLEDSRNDPSSIANRPPTQESPVPERR